MGFTTLECIDILDDCLWNKNFNAVIIAHDKESLKKIFKKVKLAWLEFEKELGTALGFVADTSNSNMLQFNNGSTVSVALSSRSDTVNRLHVSEFGKICKKYPLKAEEIITGAFPSVPASGRIDIESTAEGEVGYFHDMFWEAWEEGEPDNQLNFKAHFFPWSEYSDYRMKSISSIPEKFREYQRKHNLDDEQITWYFGMQSKLKELMKQEYPTTPEEAFESSGHKVFDPEVINRRIARDVEEGEAIGKWKFFDDFKLGHVYACGADPAEGVGRDSSSAHIIDYSHRTEHGVIKPKVVAVFCDNKVEPDMFAHELKRGCSRYGDCILAVERNGTGLATLTVLKDIYFNLYTEKRKDQTLDKDTDRLGFLTSASTKPMIIYNLKTAINEDDLLIPDKPTLRELRLYDEEDLKRLRFDPEISHHLDRVMSLAIAYELRNYAIASGNITATEEPLIEGVYIQ